ncbi:hypothetical protein GGX14DRAFT_470874 [Mycena pura]|uniref:Uncharacterized protein n=1 Tax=Mycena pura TaxID=153505 RepID=A0AAD6V219_9AGAR|nr:hypothetical protein GGX14DRAFT_470874 [Mycena pura]
MSRFLISLELLPTVSPGLTVLKLDILRGPETHVRLLEKVVNSLRLPCLEVASIRVPTSIQGPRRDNIPGPDPDFTPFLEAHPTLYDVSVILGSQPLCDDALPLLQTFAGRADDFLKVRDSARPIRDLAVTLFLRNYNDGRIIKRERAVVAALTKTPNLRRLAIITAQFALLGERVRGLRT